MMKSAVVARDENHSRYSSSSSASVRRLINANLISDSDLDAFCQDYFPEVSTRFTSGMDKVAKINLLLQRVSAEQVLAALHEFSPCLVDRKPSINRLSLGSAIKHTTLSEILRRIIFFSLSIGMGMGMGMWGGWSMFSRTQKSVRPTETKSPKFSASELKTIYASNVNQINIIASDEWKYINNFSVPEYSPEGFAEYATKLGVDAIISTEKRFNERDRDWVTTVFLINGRTGESVAMLRYSRARVQAWSQQIITINSSAYILILAIENFLDKPMQPVPAISLAPPSPLVRRNSLVRTVDRDAANEKVEEGQLAISSGDYAVAYHFCRDAMGNRQIRPRALICASEAELYQGHYLSAIELAKEAEQVKPGTRNGSILAFRPHLH